MKRCVECERGYPDHLVTTDNEFYNHDTGQMMSLALCAVCGLKMRNQQHGMDAATPFSGKKAHAMFLETVKFLGPAAPGWARYIVENKLGPGDDPRGTHESLGS